MPVQTRSLLHIHEKTLPKGMVHGFKQWEHTCTQRNSTRKVQNMQFLRPHHPSHITVAAFPLRLMPPSDCRMKVFSAKEISQEEWHDVVTCCHHCISLSMILSAAWNLIQSIGSCFVTHTRGMTLHFGLARKWVTSIPIPVDDYHLLIVLTDHCFL